MNSLKDTEAYKLGLLRRRAEMGDFGNFIDAVRLYFGKGGNGNVHPHLDIAIEKAMERERRGINSGLSGTGWNRWLFPNKDWEAIGKEVCKVRIPYNNFSSLVDLVINAGLIFEGLHSFYLCNRNDLRPYLFGVHPEDVALKYAMIHADRFKPFISVVNNRTPPHLSKGFPGLAIPPTLEDQTRATVFLLRNYSGTQHL